MVFLSRNVGFSIFYTMLYPAVVLFPLNNVPCDDHPSGCICVQVQSTWTSRSLMWIVQLVPIAGTLFYDAWMLRAVPNLMGVWVYEFLQPRGSRESSACTRFNFFLPHFSWIYHCVLSIATDFAPVNDVVTICLTSAALGLAALHLGTTGWIPQGRSWRIQRHPINAG